MRWFGKISIVVASVALSVLPASEAKGSFQVPARRHAKGGYRYLIGLQLYTVRDDCARDLPGVLKAVAKMGYTGVEFAGYYGRSAEDLRQMLDDDRLKCYGSHLSLDDLLGDNFAKTVAFNQVLGNKLLVVPSLPNERRNSHTALLETAKLFNEIAQKLEPEGMMLAYHDHAEDFKMVDGEMMWMTLFNNTDSRVKIQFDIGNALEAGQQAAPYIKKFPGRVVSVHVKDYSPTKPQALLGEGDESWKDVLPLFKGPNRPKWLIVEQETYPYPPLVCAEKCLRNFEALLTLN
jgi:sugar phosphate isomerase/epimerase